MRYTPDDALREIQYRSRKILRKREQRRCRILSVLSVALSGALIMIISVLPENSAVSSAGSVYGSFLLSREAGGYVLTALIAFILGITVTLLCKKAGNRKKGKK